MLTLLTEDPSQSPEAIKRKVGSGAVNSGARKVKSGMASLASLGHSRSMRSSLVHLSLPPNTSMCTHTKLEDGAGVGGGGGLPGIPGTGR